MKLDENYNYRFEQALDQDLAEEESVPIIPIEPEVIKVEKPEYVTLCVFVGCVMGVFFSSVIFWSLQLYQGF